MRITYFIFVSLGLACSSSTPAGPVTNITVSTGDLIPAFSTNITDYEVTSLTTLVPISITVAGQDTTINGVVAKNGVAQSLTLTTLDDATVISINAVDATGAPVTFKIHTVPAIRPQYNVTTNNAPTPGHILVAPNQLKPTQVTPLPSFLEIYDETGKLEFYKKTNNPAFDFQKWTLTSGTVRYSYISTDAPIDWTTWPVEACTVHVLDDHFNELQALKLLAADGHPAEGTDAHDVKLIDDNHWIIESYIGQTVTNVPGFATANVVGAVVQEVENGTVTFDWQTTTVPELYTDSADPCCDNYAQAVPQDYNHLNSLDVDPANGNPVVSLRHDDAVVEADKTSGAIVWMLGGKGDQFGLAAADKSSHQHFVRFLEPNHLMMFDNGNATQTTKIREYQLDPTNHTAQVLAAVAVDAHFSMAMGSVQKLGNRYFVGWGYRNTNDSDITELDATTHEKSFELTFTNGYLSYRALKYAN